MRIDQPGLVLLGIAAVLAVAVLLAFTWDRRGKIWRSALVAVSVLGVATTAGLQLNRMTEAYPSWSALLGDTPKHQAQKDPTDPVEEPPDADTGPTTGAPVAGGASKMVTVTVPGPASGLTLSMYVYLPGSY